MAVTVRASQEGLDLIDKARRKKGWSKTEKAWIDLAQTSQATLKRFWACIPIQTETFQLICKTVGIDDCWTVADLEVDVKTPIKNLRKRVTLTLDIDPKELDYLKLSEIVAEFTMLGGDQSIQLMDIDNGSIKLIFNGSDEAFEELLTLYQSGELNEICGVPVIQLTYQSKEQLVELIRKNGGNGLDLRGADLTGTDLTRASLSGAYLSGADLTGADLSGADLTRADLTGADLTGVDLIETYLVGADFYEANLCEANLYGAHLYRAHLYGAYLFKANLSGANLSGAYLAEAHIAEVNFSGAYLAEADLSETDLSETDLSEANLAGASLFNANLTRANLTGANLTGTIFANNPGLSETDKLDMQRRGAIFPESPNSDVPRVVKR